MRLFLIALCLLGSVVAVAEEPAQQNCAVLNKEHNVVGCDFGIAICFLGKSSMQCFPKVAPAPAQAPAQAAKQAAKKPAASKK